MRILSSNEICRDGIIRKDRDSIYETEHEEMSDTLQNILVWFLIRKI